MEVQELFTSARRIVRRRPRESGRFPDFRWSSWFIHCAAVSRSRYLQPPIVDQNLIFGPVLRSGDGAPEAAMNQAGAKLRDPARESEFLNGDLFGKQPGVADFRCRVPERDGSVTGFVDQHLGEQLTGLSGEIVRRGRQAWPLERRELRSVGIKSFHDQEHVSVDESGWNAVAGVPR